MAAAIPLISLGLQAGGATYSAIQQNKATKKADQAAADNERRQTALLEQQKANDLKQEVDKENLASSTINIRRLRAGAVTAQKRAISVSPTISKTLIGQ